MDASCAVDPCGGTGDAQTAPAGLGSIAHSARPRSEELTDTNTQRTNAFKRYLVVAYVGVAVVSGIGLARGWSDSSVGVRRQASSCLILALCAATLFVQNMQGNQRPFAFLDILKFIACVFGALAWILVATRIMPDTIPGSVTVMIPTMGLFLWGMYYLSSPFSSMWRGATTAVWLKPGTVSLTVPYQGFPVNNIMATAPDRLEVAVNYGAIAGRYFGVIFLCAAYWWLFEKDSVVAAIILALGGLFITNQVLRMVLGDGPGLVMTSKGLVIRRGIATVTDLFWTDITTMELKAAMGSTALMIRVRDPESLMAQARGYTRWSMRKSQDLYGSPVRIPTFALNCNGHWLAGKVAEFKARYGNA